jgi:hypothetical protein
MNSFKKALKLATKAAHHAFRNPDLKCRTEAVDAYLAEGVTERLIKKMKKKNYDNNVRECGNVRSKYNSMKGN